jgi:ribulose kinase
MRIGPTRAVELAAERHWQPNILGNRAPLADPTLTGGTFGVTMRDDLEDLALWYLAAIQALAYASRHIVEALRESGREVELVMACGGSVTNGWWLQAHSDALGVRVATTKQPDAVLVGAAILGATASGAHASLEEAMSAMTRVEGYRPPDPRFAAYHDAKYAVYRRMLDDHRAYRRMMGSY